MIHDRKVFNQNLLSAGKYRKLERLHETNDLRPGSYSKEEVLGGQAKSGTNLI
jgi:hypothetical protein